MKLAEALLLRADLQKKFESLRQRINQNATVQEDEEPAEDPKKLLKVADDVLRQLDEIIFKINKTNLSHKLADGRTLTEALAHLDVLKMKHSLIQSAVEGAARPPDRYGLSEIRWIPVLNAEELQAQADVISKQIRELNASIQEANWTTEIE